MVLRKSDGERCSNTLPVGSGPVLEEEAQSKYGIVHLALDVKTWIAHPPSAEAARPGQCPKCGAASRPAGAGLGLWGHGVRERQQRGPLDPAGEPVTITVAARRYACRICDAIILVVPSDVAPRRHYSRSAIGLAVALFGVARRTVAEIRRRVSPWQIVGDAAVGSWAALRRWVAAIRRGGIFPGVRAVPAGFTARQAAERIATTVAAHAPLSCTALALPHQAFVGARHMR